MCEINAEEVNDRAKLLSHRLVARRLASDPNLIDRAHEVLKRQRDQWPGYEFLDEWEHLLDLGAERLRRLITARSEMMVRLRISSPLGIASGMFVENEALRRRIRKKAKNGIILRAARAQEAMLRSPAV